MNTPEAGVTLARKIGVLQATALAAEGPADASYRVAVVSGTGEGG